MQFEIRVCCLTTLFDWELLTILRDTGATRRVSTFSICSERYCLIYAIILMITLWSFLAQPAQAQLDGISELGHSYQSDARGGCETSIGDTALAHVRQPASVLLQKTSKFDSKLTNIFVLNNSWTSPLTGEKTRSQVDQLFAYNLGAVKKIGHRYALGLAFETGGWTTAFPNRSLSARFFEPVTSSLGYKKYSVTGNFGFRLSEKWMIGAGPHIDVIRFATDVPMGGGLLRVPTTYSVGAGYQIGLLYRPTPHFSLGASFFSP